MRSQQLRGNSAVIEQREREIVEIAQSIAELAEIMKDMAILIIEQGTVIDTIAYNITLAEAAVEGGKNELIEGEKYQKRNKKTMCIMCLGVIIIIVMFALIAKKA